MTSARGKTTGFAESTLKNMEYVKHSFEQHGPGEVHMVTQVMNHSLA